MRRALTLTQRLNLLVLAALAPALLLLVYTQITQRSARMEEASQAAYRAGEQASLEMQRIVSGAQLLSEAIGNAPAVITFDQALCAPFLASVVARAPQFSAISVYDGDGVLRCRNLTRRAPRQRFGTCHRSLRSCPPAASPSGATRRAKATRDANLPLAAPILNNENRPIGAVIASLDLRWLNHIVENRQFDDSAALTIATGMAPSSHAIPFPSASSAPRYRSSSCRWSLPRNRGRWRS